MREERNFTKKEMIESRNSSSEVAVAANIHIEEKEYWLNKLQGKLTKNVFPYDDIKGEADAKDTPGPKNFERVNFCITGELFSLIVKIGNGSDPRVHMLLTVGLVVLLYKHSGSKDIILGMPVYKQEVEGDFLNTALALRNSINGDMTFKVLLSRVRQTIKEAVENQNYPIEVLAKQVDLEVNGDSFPLFGIAILLENIHDKTYLSHLDLDMLFSCKRTEESLEIVVEYNPALYLRQNAKMIGQRFVRVMEAAYSIDLPVSMIDILPGEEKTQLLSYAVGPRKEYPIEKFIPHFIKEYAKRQPSQPAVICGDECLTYCQLEERAIQLAIYLLNLSLKPEDRVGILLDRSINSVVAILAVWKAGGAYVPIEAGLPGKRIATIINDAQIGVILSEKKYIKILNSLQWDCQCFHTFFCMDSNDIYAEEEYERSLLMDPKLWEYIGETAEDDIMGGGWISSYTGEHFSREEVEEFAENLFQKLTPLLDEKMRVLEIGSASGISMYRIAPLVGFYYGTDISRVIIEKNKKRVEKENFKNIALAPLAAHEIHQIEERNFDLVIINSVIQDFHGHNYLRQVIRKAVEKLGDKGYLFIGDVMDQNSKEALIRDLTSFKRENRNKNYKTKLNWDAELFISRSFFQDLAFETPGIQKVEFSNKIFTIENELTKFRYDVLIHVDKGKEKPLHDKGKHKFQHDTGALANLAGDNVECRTTSSGLAYVIYTSGSTGKPKGAMVEHIGMMNHIWAKIDDLRLTGQSVVAQNSPFAFDISVWQFFSTLVTGGKTIIYTDEVVMNPPLFINRLKQDGVTILEVVPSYLSLLLDTVESTPVSFDSLTYLLVTGEVVNPGLVKRWFGKYPGIPMVNAYGPTEASDDITHYIMAGTPGGDRIPIGRPLQNLRIYIVDNDMNLCPPGVKGEIVVSGVGVGRGYLGDEEKTDQVFSTDPFRTGGEIARLYRTGDMGLWLPDGNIDFLGRKDYQVKLRGFRIELGEIENRLVQMPEVKETVVTIGENEQEHQYLCAYIVPDTHCVSGDFDVYELKELLKGQLADYMVPQYFVKMDKLPLTPNGKADRKNLPCPEIKVSEDYEAPGNETEEKLVEVLAEVLGINQSGIGVQDNFFDLGANSITILKIHNRVNEVLNYDISLSVLFIYSTVRELALNIKEEKFLEQLECIVKLNVGQNKKNLFILHPAHGMVYQYKNLARLLTNHYNVYGIQTRSIISDNPIPGNSVEMVEDYLWQIRAIQERGPYFIAGYCYGCLIGYELVKQLELGGDIVSTYLMFDEPVLGTPRQHKILRRLDRRRALFAPMMNLFSWLKKLTGSKEKEGSQQQKYEVKAGAKRKFAGELPDKNIQDIQERIEEKIRNLEYRISGIIKANMFVIKAKESSNKGYDLEGFGRMTYGKVYFELTEGDHDSMFYPPNVKRLAEIIINKVES